MSGVGDNRRWRIWGGFTIVFTVIAETLNIMELDQLFIEWVLFILAVVCFLFAITAWDRRKRPGPPPAPPGLA